MQHTGNAPLLHILIALAVLVRRPGRMTSSTARACLRSESVLVQSHNNSHASSRVNVPTPPSFFPFVTLRDLRGSLFSFFFLWDHTTRRPHCEIRNILYNTRRMKNGSAKDAKEREEEERQMDLGLQGKKAIVAGASRGIGKAIAIDLAREGVDMAIVSRSQADLDKTAQEIRDDTGRTVIPIALDVTQRDQVDRVVAEAAAQLGGLHILVNSASLPGGSATATGPIESVVDEDLISDFNVKYVGALRMSRAAIPFLKEQGWGRIINISGGNARNAGNLSGGARNVSMVHMTKTLSVQLGRFGITVNCIHPGITRTERTPGMLEARAAQLGITAEELEKQDFAPDAPRGNAICRMVDAMEIAYVTSFLASDRAWSITGEVISANGGVGTSVYY